MYNETQQNEALKPMVPPPWKRHRVASLLHDASDEIKRLRERLERLDAYHLHTERMLALFEGGPRSHGVGYASPGIEHIIDNYLDTHVWPEEKPEDDGALMRQDIEHLKQQLQQEAEGRRQGRESAEKAYRGKP